MFVCIGLSNSSFSLCLSGVLGRRCCSKQDVCLHFSPSLIATEDFFSDWTLIPLLLNAPLLRTRAPISGLSSTADLQQSPVTPQNSWIMDGKYPWGPGGGKPRTPWTDPRETSDPEGRKDGGQSFSGVKKNRWKEKGWNQNWSTAAFFRNLLS